MQEFSFKFTQDGSVGLYDNNYKDIMHSVTGALKESFDKFIYPVDFISFAKDNDTNILDICFGVGYNTKAILYSILKNCIKTKIKIYALEINPMLCYLSPFIKDSIQEPDVSLFLLSYFICNYDDYISTVDKYIKTNTEIVNHFFKTDICSLFEKCKHDTYINNPQMSNLSFLHNIYYQNISKSMKTDLNLNKYTNVDFNILIGDARRTIKSLNNELDFIFLDGYTPHKQPILWTADFLGILKTKLKPTGLLTTYSNSTPVRSTLLNLGFYVGKILLNSAQFGTVASKDSSKIINQLTNYDYGLIQTKAGIPYRDKPLNLSSSEIIKNRENELNNSSKMSSTQYKKRCENEI